VSLPRRTLVVGAARSGRAAGRLLVALGERVALTDDALRIEDPPPGVDVVPRAEADRLLDRIGQVVVSPGVAKTHPLVISALARGLPVRSELALAAEHVRGRVIAVTGTNGKSTVTTLLAESLREAGRRVFAGGNLGTPLSNAVGGDYQDLVIEVSSFQLEWPHSLVPAVATVLNVSPDHLDRHGSLAGYIRAKMNLFANMGPAQHAVFCRDETWWRGEISRYRATVSTFGRAAFADGEAGTVFTTRPRSVTARLPERRPLALGERWPLYPHDVENVAAVVEMARVAGAPLEAVERAVERFSPLPHRLTLVGVRGGVKFFDDSKATNVGATAKSLEAFDEPVILLAGGSGKGVAFEGLAAGLGRVKLVVAYGEAGGAIAADLQGRVPLVRVRGFDDAFAAAVERAVAGDVVLLAPACASFDEFRNYGERGERFVARVTALGEG
jgi:UDP-N-acetylmuramoylalanine--D-glutamate ligase